MLGNKDMKASIETLMDWIKQEIKEIKEGINFIRNNSLPYLHSRIDVLGEKITYIEGQNKIRAENQTINRWLYMIVIILLTGFATILGIKYFPGVILK